MPAPRKYRSIRRFPLSVETDIFTELEELSHRERRSINTKINELIIQAVERAGIGENNPLGITYGPPVQQKITSFNTENPLEVLDWCIDNGIIGIKNWQAAFAEIEDQELMQRLVNLTDVIHTTAKNRLSFLKTGKAVVSTGKVEHPVPMMKGTRSGF